MALNPSIILAGNNPDIFGSYARGQQVGQQAVENRRMNALAQLYQDQGPQIAAGDRNALNALARFDPQAAMGVEQNRARMDAMSAQERRQAEEYAASKSAAERQATAARIEEGVRMGMAAQTPEQWDAMMAQVDPSLVGMFGQRQMIANKYMTMAEILKGQQPEKPADEYQRYVQEEAAAGRQPLDRISFAKAKQKQSSIEVQPDGTVRVTEGGNAQPSERVNVDPAAFDTVISQIDAIAGDENLGRVTGPLEGGGGNDVEQLNMAQRAYYGSGGLSLIEKIGQLQSGMWLSARQMLKGGGAITDYESRKAEAAMARLSRVKNEAEFKAALDDLRSAIIEGRDKLIAARGGQRQQPTATQSYGRNADGSLPDFSAMSDADLDAWIQQNGGGQ